MRGYFCGRARAGFSPARRGAAPNPNAQRARVHTYVRRAQTKPRIRFLKDLLLKYMCT